ncbi:hypothetical protein B7G54_26175 [Burkholderia puraquae]|uniref:Uncharacterized protein n=1 Tax=Burkholderia puraquae TaxID=1904757 RepID=A0A1X1PBK8_9BURK|nr:hypothetical protein B7G54_26175 [Burkholderia puraquae]CAB3764184.1 hypothetical protein LMG29660_04944 [Burkholderia puraquae]
MIVERFTDAGNLRRIESIPLGDDAFEKSCARLFGPPGCGRRHDIRLHAECTECVLRLDGLIPRNADQHAGFAQPLQATHDVEGEIFRVTAWVRQLDSRAI